MKFAQILIAIISCTTGSVCAYGQAQVCPRFTSGSVITQPEDLYSQNGVLMVNFTYNTRVDDAGNVLYCFTNSGDGAESPTLHVYPGDKLIVNLKNALPPSAPITAMKGMDMSMEPATSTPGTNTCGNAVTTASSVNMHYHGTNTPPTCHQDEVIRTLVNSGDTFTYTLQFPQDEPPGLYWYHPHVHGIADAAVNGGATGAIVVEGIQNWNPSLVGLPVQLLVLRDYPNPLQGLNDPSWNISLNYVPIPYPAYPPAIIQMQPSQKQFWRVVNSSADTIWDLQLLYDGIPQTFSVVAQDGVPTGSQDGGSTSKSITQTDIYLPPATRSEFIVVGPSTSVKNAQLITLGVDTGELGDSTPQRPVANIQLTSNSQTINSTTSKLPVIPAVSGPPPIPRFGNLRDVVPNTTRNLYFSELLGTDRATKSSRIKTSKSNKPSKKATPPLNVEPTLFFITVVGQPPKLFSPNNPPAIITTHGSVEDWIIENRALEPHEFHIHQIHFLVLEVNGIPVKDGQYRDTFEVPLWTGQGAYPNVKLRMDFRGPTVGDFVYHCHILGHEDGGMMAIIRVQ